MTRLLTTWQYLMFITMTNYLAVIAGITLWSALFILGLIARRLERAFQVPTSWRLLLFAPSGILLYTVYSLVAAGGGAGTPEGSLIERRIAHSAFLLSACLSLWGCWSTWSLLLRLAAARRRAASA